ncbi:hypothetical protein AMECASPLE_017019 [Ameca splendens]|uniref:Uncharacterized protein n=1 Tax=Ameca splendens TaxID=208324 RepID=A0ABV0ZB41_9TELE
MIVLLYKRTRFNFVKTSYFLIAEIITEKENMVLFISLCWMLSVESMMGTFADQAVPLGMAEDSVDDMYFGCENKMKQILDQRFSKELSQNWDCNPISFWKKLQLF